jgi:hypothetical protein
MIVLPRCSFIRNEGQQCITAQHNTAQYHKKKLSSSYLCYLLVRLGEWLGQHEDDHRVRRGAHVVGSETRPEGEDALRAQYGSDGVEHAGVFVAILCVVLCCVALCGVVLRRGRGERERERDLLALAMNECEKLFVVIHQQQRKEEERRKALLTQSGLE